MSITEHFNALTSNQEVLSKANDQVISRSQQSEYFSLALAKEQRRARLESSFSQQVIQNVFLGGNLSGFELALGGIQTHVLERKFFADSNEADRKAKVSLLDGAIVIVNNNDVGSFGSMAEYASIYSACPNTIFIVWDWDNHHWLDLSYFLAAHSDIYAPAHHENLYLLSRYNWLTTGPVYCATVQWSKGLLTENLAQIIGAKRSESPLGKHIPYHPFSFRSQVIKTLSNSCSNIGFSDRSFHDRSARDRLAEWCSFRLHWIVPVLNDIPIRIFDALVTGGIPIVPESLRFQTPINTIGSEHIFFYRPSDILEPSKLINAANAAFERDGIDGIVARHRFALKCHHGDSRMIQLLGFGSLAFNFRLPDPSIQSPCAPITPNREF